MIGLVLVTHGGLGACLRDAMEHVVGAQPQMAVIGIDAEDDLIARRAEVAAHVAEVDTGDGVIVLTDMFGSTPSNIAIAMLGRPHLEVLAGVNLPMLVKLAKTRGSRDLDGCATLAAAVGRKYIASASHLPAPCLGGATCCEPQEVPVEDIIANRSTMTVSGEPASVGSLPLFAGPATGQRQERSPATPGLMARLAG